ncbi:hypothetical protein [Hahella ganghwensis]|uniref:hypothetical protein n=1 Tax=Hahella ganghwensis TaxID=286420 RepID=UPI00035E1788|nr:hypothetical protein [Hahella ganghwensis]
MKTVGVAIIWLLASLAAGWITEQDYQHSKSSWESFCENQPMSEQCKEFVKPEGE